MRPVNLVPPEQRRGERAPSRRGPAAYAIVGALALALVAITAIVLTNNTISERKAQVATLEAKEADAKEVAESLSPYAEFASLQQARVATVTTLAESRFDWERVMRELGMIIPEGVWLTTMTGTVRPDVQLSEASGSELRQQIAGPALALTGCGFSHPAVAEFIAALEDIDGVTRVAVSHSEIPDDEAGAAGAASSSGNGAATCPDDVPLANFEAIVAFDEAPVSTPTVTPGAPAPAEGEETQVSEGTSEQNEARGNAQEQSERGRDAANLVPGTVR